MHIHIDTKLNKRVNNHFGTCIWTNLIAFGFIMIHYNSFMWVKVVLRFYFIFFNKISLVVVYILVICKLNWTLTFYAQSNRMKVKLFLLYLLAFCKAPSVGFDSWCTSLSTQHDHIIPPEQRSNGFPPARTRKCIVVIM